MGHVENDEEGNEERVESDLRCWCGGRELWVICCWSATGLGLPWILVRRRLVTNAQRKIGWGYDVITLTGLPCVNLKNPPARVFLIQSFVIRGP